MKTIHVVPSLDLLKGGPSKSVSDLAINQVLQGEKITIFTNYSKQPYLKVSPLSNLNIHFAKLNKFKKDLFHLILNCEYDILHGHGIWEMPVHYMAQIGRKEKKPYIITPRGMLEPWALNAGKWKKKLAMALYQRRDLKSASCIHVTAEMEAESIRKLGFDNPIAVIPNGIDISVFPILGDSDSKSQKTLLYLSRIHPKKGIELLIEAWSQLGKKVRADWQVEIVGNGEERYVNFLEKEIQEKGLSSEIRITGPQFGEDKLAAYHRADLFVLPTYSENFGIVVAEALAYGVPVITTKGTPWEELNSYQAGWWINIGVNPLVEALKEALQLDKSILTQKGLNGRNLIKEKYSIEAVAKQMITLYQWILEGKEKPEFVFD